MSTELQIRPDQTSFDDKQLAALRSIGVANAPNADIALFFHQAARTGLDPFSRQIYLINRGGKWTIQTAIDGFRLIRDRKGTYRGHTEEWCGTDGIWTDVWLQKQPPAAARVLIYVEGYVKPVPGVALWNEYAQMGRDGKPQALWASKPALMLAKCAEALALRKAYSQDLSGLYTTDEIPEAEQDADGVHVVTSMRAIGNPQGINEESGHANETRVVSESDRQHIPGPGRVTGPSRTVDLSGAGRDNPPAPKKPPTGSATSWIRDIAACADMGALTELRQMAVAADALAMKTPQGLTVDAAFNTRREDLTQPAAGDRHPVPDVTLYGLNDGDYGDAEEPF